MKARISDEAGYQVTAELIIYRELQKERFSKMFQTLQLRLAIHPKKKKFYLLSVWDERDKLI